MPVADVNKTESERKSLRNSGANKSFHPERIYCSNVPSGSEKE